MKPLIQVGSRGKPYNPTLPVLPSEILEKIASINSRDEEVILQKPTKSTTIFYRRPLGPKFETRLLKKALYEPSVAKGAVAAGRRTSVVRRKLDKFKL